jgi:hypothetical protein
MRTPWLSSEKWSTFFLAAKQGKKEVLQLQPSRSGVHPLSTRFAQITAHRTDSRHLHRASNFIAFIQPSLAFAALYL